jgi:hypothetical protein
MVNRRRGHHFRVKLRSRTQQPQEKTAMPVRPVHHGRTGHDWGQPPTFLFVVFSFTIQLDKANLFGLIANDSAPILYQIRPMSHHVAPPMSHFIFPNGLCKWPLFVLAAVKTGP